MTGKALEVERRIQIIMKLWVFVLLATTSVFADHNAFHTTDPFAFQNDPQQSIAYAIPVQIYSSSAAAPAAEVYSAPASTIYTAPAPQVYTATIAPAPQVYAAVTPAPQLAVQNVEVQSYQAPVYSAQGYSAPIYSAQSYSAPSYSSKTYSSPSYSAPSYSAQSYSAPSFSPKTYSAPSYFAQSYSSSQYSSPVSSVSSQFKSPAKIYTKTSYLSPSSVKSYSAISKSSYSSPVKTISAPQYSAVKFEAPKVQYQAPAVKYQSSAINQYSSGAYVKPIAILRQSQDDGFDGSFSYDFQAENGIASSASGYVKQLSPKEHAQVIQGEYSYTAPDGTPVVTRWFADETGFHAEGSHLPVAPPVPEAIAKSLAYKGVTY